MVLRKNNSPLVKVTGNLYRDDWRFLLETLPASGAFVFVRDLVHTKVAELRNVVLEQRKEDMVEVENV
jgi:hypothetical protein